MVGVSASVNLHLHHKVQKFSSLLAPAHLGGPRKRAIKWLWCVCGVVQVESLRQNLRESNMELESLRDAKKELEKYAFNYYCHFLFTG